MTILLWVFVITLSFGLGVCAAFLVISFAIAYDFKDKTGCWISYSKKHKRWEILGDLPLCYSKAIADPKLKRKYNS